MSLNLNKLLTWKLRLCLVRRCLIAIDLA